MKSVYVSNENEKLLREVAGFDELVWPTIQEAMDFLLDEYKLHLQPEPYFCEDGLVWLCKIIRIEEQNTNLIKTITGCDSKELAVDKAIDYIINNDRERFKGWRSS